MKKLLSSILALTMVCTLLPTAAFAQSTNDYESIKQRVSDIYGMPIEVVNSLNEEKVRSLYVEENQVISVEEQYIHVAVDENGEAASSVQSKASYEAAVNTPTPFGNPTTETHEDGWMKIYLIIIDRGDELDISSTYTWLVQPRVTYKQEDMLTLKWENGSYIPNSAEGFYSYNVNGITYHNEDLVSSRFKRPYEDLKSMNYAHPMNDSGARRNEFFHMMVTIEKDTGSSRETALSAYGHQYKTLGFNMGTAFGAIGGVASAFFLPPPYNAYGMTAAAVGVLGQTKTCYDTFVVEANGSF